MVGGKFDMRTAHVRAGVATALHLRWKSWGGLRPRASQPTFSDAEPGELYPRQVDPVGEVPEPLSSDHREVISKRTAQLRIADIIVTSAAVMNNEQFHPAQRRVLPSAANLVTHDRNSPCAENLRTTQKNACREQCLGDSTQRRPVRPPSGAVFARAPIDSRGSVH